MPATTGAPGPGTGPPGEASVPAPGSRWRRTFSGDEGELSTLRHWLASVLPACPARDDVASVATELGSNAIRHTASGCRGWFAVEVSWLGSPAAVRLAVADGGAPAGPTMIDDPLAEHGRGLMLVNGLSSRTGVSGDERGRVVWADIPWGNAPGEAPAAAHDPYEDAIRDGLTALSGRFPGVLVWFGRATLQWWALVDRGYASRLLSAQSPSELAGAVEDTLAVMPPAPAGHDGEATVAWLGSRKRGSTGPYRVRPQRPAPPLGPAAGFAAAPTPGAEPTGSLSRRAG